MAAWMDQDATRMEVGLSPADFVLDMGTQPPSQKGAEPPILGPCLLWPKGWMDQHDNMAFSMEVGVGPATLC